MKQAYPIYILLIVAVLSVNFMCMKSVSSGSNEEMSAGVKNMLQNRWTYISWSSCPANPLSGAPCVMYVAADTALYGDGHITLDISTDNKISWAIQGSFPFSPYCYAYSAANNTVNYQLVNDSTFLLVNTSSEIMDTVKIKSLSDHLLVLSYRVPQFGNPYQLDSLSR